jgi:hypothetical protein
MLDSRRESPDAVSMAVGIELERVVRTTGGRVHLTPHVPEAGPVVTLCGQTLAEGRYRATDAEADCRTCVRRRTDPGRVSGAFFQSDVGAELLQRSLEQARAMRAQRPVQAAEPQPPRRAEPPPEPPPPPPIPELRSHPPLRRAFENVLVSPEGVLLRVDPGKGLTHVTFDGPIDLRRRGGVLTVRVGDIVLEF